MISKKDVITMKVPFPNISANLAVNAHMYICQYTAGKERRFLKCQTLKPYMLYNAVMSHYWDEEADINRNPFMRKTRIDCDKLFITKNIQYSLRMRTATRPDVCDDLMRNAERELFADGYLTCNIIENDLLSLNHLASKI